MPLRIVDDDVRSPVQPLVIAVAHQVAADLARLGITISPASASAQIQELGIEVIVTVREIGPAVGRLADVPNAKPLAVPFDSLSGVQKCVVKFLRDQTAPKKGATIAAKLKVVNGGSFRAMLSDLCRLGVLRNDGDGYVVNVRVDHGGRPD